MIKDSVFIFSGDQLSYKFSDDHPFNQIRLELTLDLLKKMNAIHEADIVPPRMATDEELELIHLPEYIDAVKKAGRGELPKEIAENYGIGTEDTPIFPNMHEATALIVVEP